MAGKEPKTAHQLNELVMKELRKYPDLDYIVNVGIAECMRRASHYPNWEPNFGMDKEHTAPEKAFSIVKELQNKYDCLWLHRQKTPR